MSEKSIILFDSKCGACDHFVHFILKNDIYNHFLFCPLQSPNGIKYIEKLKLQAYYMQTVILISNDHVYLHSNAVFKILKKLKFPYSKVALCSILPEKFTDFCYAIIAKYRHILFKKNACRLLSDLEKEKFI
jgi:predicted DCC family thiol-disulfide oxidoreductase YuxK